MGSGKVALRGPVQGDNEVDLYASTEVVQLRPNGTGTLTFTVGNYGPNATVGPVRVVVVMPFWANAVGTAAQPPAGFSFLNENKQPNVPEILEHVITDRLEPKQERTLQVPIELLPGGPRVPGIGLRGPSLPHHGSPPRECAYRPVLPPKA